MADLKITQARGESAASPAPRGGAFGRLRGPAQRQAAVLEINLPEPVGAELVLAVHAGPAVLIPAGLGLVVDVRAPLAELLARSYRAALEHGYLWHEFGDSHLLLP